MRIPHNSDTDSSGNGKLEDGKLKAGKSGFGRFEDENSAISKSDSDRDRIKNSDRRGESDESTLTQNSDEHEFSEGADNLWRLIFSPTIWVAHFLACYISTAIVCAGIQGDQTVTGLRAFIVIATVSSLAGIATIGWKSWKQWDFVKGHVHEQSSPTNEHRHQFLGHASFLLSIVSFIGVFYVSMPALFLDSCQ